MPNAVLEAMAARRPVIGTAVEGTEDLVIPGRTGWLVPPRDVTALCHALIEAADSPADCSPTVKQAASALNGNSRSKRPSRPTNVSGPESWDSELPSPEASLELGRRPRDRIRSLLVAHAPFTIQVATRCPWFVPRPTTTGRPYSKN